jgi:hypothetical protein
VRIGDVGLALSMRDFGFEGSGVVVITTGLAGPPTEHDATFEGRVDGDRMTLTIDPPSVGLGPFELELGREEQVPLCP